MKVDDREIAAATITAVDKGGCVLSAMSAWIVAERRKRADVP
jgi:hypothetical protein